MKYFSMRTIVSLSFLILATHAPSLTLSAQEKIPAQLHDTQQDDAESLSKISSDALIQEYIKRRDLGLWVKAPNLPEIGPTLIDSVKQIVTWLELHKQHAASLLEQSELFAKAGDPSALGTAAFLLWDKSIINPLQRDPCRAVSYAFDGAIHANLAAMTTLALAYASGDGLPKDERRAYFWAREVTHRDSSVGEDGMTSEILSATSPQQRVQFEMEWLQWSPHIDVKEQKNLICK